MKKLKFLLISSVLLINSCNNMDKNNNPIPGAKGALEGIYASLTDGIYADIQTNKGDMILKLTY